MVEQWRLERLSDEQAGTIRDGLLDDLADHSKSTTDRKAQLDSRIETIQRERRKWAEKAMTGVVPDDIARDEQTRLGTQLRVAGENLASLQITTNRHADAIRTVTALLPNCGEAYRRGPQQLRREYNQAWFKGVYFSARDGQPEIARAVRTEPFEAMRTAEVAATPQIVHNVFQTVINNENKPAEQKWRHSFRCRAISRVTGSNCHFWWS